MREQIKKSSVEPDRFETVEQPVSAPTPEVPRISPLVEASFGSASPEKVELSKLPGLDNLSPIPREEANKLVDRIVDGRGRRVDNKIKGPLAALISAGFPTMSSCEGHPEKDTGQSLSPFIEIGAEKQMLRFSLVGQREVFESKLKQEIKIPFATRLMNLEFFGWSGLLSSSLSVEQAEKMESSRLRLKNPDLWEKVLSLNSEAYNEVDGRYQADLFLNAGKTSDHLSGHHPLLTDAEKEKARINTALKELCEVLVEDYYANSPTPDETVRVIVRGHDGYPFDLCCGRAPEADQELRQTCSPVELQRLVEARQKEVSAVAEYIFRQAAKVKG